MRFIRARFACATLLALSGCSTDGGEASPASHAEATGATAAARSPYLTCATHREPSACADSVEAVLVAASADAVRRAGDTLTIKGQEGATLTLVTGFPPEFPLSFMYAGFHPELNHHGVEMGRFEGGEYILVDALTTNQTHVFGPPAVSPAGTRFATTSLDLVAGHNVNGIQIWAIRPVGLRLEWEVRGGSTWGADNAQWRGEDQLSFDIHRYDSASPYTPRVRRMNLFLQEDGVEVVPALP